MPADRMQIIVVDDGSHDDTFEEVRSTRGALDLLYAFQPDRGFRVAAARNLGLRLAKAPVVVFLDCGVAVTSSCIRAHVETLESGTTVSVGYVVGFDDGENASMVVPDEGADLDAFALRLLRSGDFPDIREPVYASCGDLLGELPAPWALAWTCNLAVRRDLPTHDVYFDEAFEGWGGEDLDFALTLSKAGALFALTRSAMSIHLPHAKPAADRARTTTANKRYLHSKHRLPETDVLMTTPAVDLNKTMSRRCTRQ